MNDFAVGEYVIIRTYSAGVHSGTLSSRQGGEVILLNSRRLWYWAGAASLSELAMYGTSAPRRCKFSVMVDRILLTEAVEIIPTTNEGRSSIEGVNEWTS